LPTDAEYETFAMSIVVDPSQRRRLLPNNIPKTKIRFLTMELLGDIFPSAWGTFDFYISIFIYICCIWIAMFVHYMGSYFYTAFLTPCYDFRIEGYQVQFKYMSESMTDTGELGIVASGPIANLLLFCLLVWLTFFIQKYARILLPDSVSITVGYFGVIAMINPILIGIISLCAKNFDCGNQSNACKLDYTSTDCDCFNADILKLYYRFNRTENSGISGLLLTLFCYVSVGFLQALALYIYMVYVHKDAKIMDLWRRIAAPPEEFFCPHDLEVSYDDMRSVISLSSRWRGPNGERRRAAVSRYYEKDASDPTFSEANRYVAIYEVHGRQSKIVYRHFNILADGSIMEIFGPFDVELIDEADNDKLLRLTESDMEKKAFGDLKYFLDSI